MPTKKVVKKPAKKTTKKVVSKKAAPKKKVATKAKAVTKKTTAKKIATKKPAAKKTTTKKRATAVKKPTKDLVYASDQESFWTTDGEILNSLIALAEAFGKMEKGVYQFHALGDQNDFAIWVETVLCDKDCAADLVKAKTHKSARTVVNKHVKNYAV